MDAPMLHAGSVLRRAMVDADIDRIVEISRTSDVGRRWQSWDRAHAQAMLADDDLACWVVDLAGDVIGFVQAYAETDPEFRHAGIDLFLDPRFHGRGLGRDTVRAVAQHLFDELDHHRIVIDPAAANTRAIRCYEAVGFRRVGVTRSSWWDHVEDRWADRVPLDLLRGELV